MNPNDWIIAAAAFSIFAFSIKFEQWYWRRRGVQKYERRDSLANNALVAMQFVFAVAGKALFIIVALDWIQRHGLHLVPNTWWAGVILFLGVDLGYYWFHRVSHRVRFLWAIHESHHSSERM